MSDATTLLAKYFAEELTPDEASRLLSLCRTDETVRNELTQMTRTERALAWLHQAGDEPGFESEVMMRIEPDTVESAAFVAGVLANVQTEQTALTAGKAGVTWFWQRVTAAAAAIALVAGAGLYFRSVGLRNDARQIETAAAAASEPHVAVVTSLSEADHTAGGPLIVGRALPAGEYRLAGGRMGLSFAGGAQLVVEGPAQLSLLSPSRARLNGGKAAAHVPEGARGFTVETPGVEVVDLGTEFGVSVGPSGVSDVHVFKGEVEARVAGDESRPESFVALNTSEGRRFASDGVAETTRPDPLSFPPPPAPAPDEPRTTGAIHFLRQPPVSVETGRLESNEFILLFKEREAADLTKETLVSFARPGRYANTRRLSAKIGPTRQVTSYLLHYDPLTRPADRSQLRREGSVTFGTPIVGVINKQSGLNYTDDVLGHPGAIYDQSSRRGVERNKRTDASGDVIVMSRDRRTLHFNLAVAGDLDQIRILVRSTSGGQGAKSVSELPVHTVKE
ncbi:MAG: FecR family protein [Verrucomicrobiaceae bacterium]|nr:FecR family protein [Verrucomicrobiaceae bacterium]